MTATWKKANGRINGDLFDFIRFDGLIELRLKAFTAKAEQLQYLVESRDLEERKLTYRKIHLRIFPFLSNILV